MGNQMHRQAAQRRLGHAPWRHAPLRLAPLRLWPLLFMASLAAGTAHAADLPPSAPPSGAVAPAQPSDWRFQATLYGWLTAIDGDVGVGRLPTVPVHASIPNVLDNLDGALMGSFFASNGQWLFLADLVLAKLSHSDQVGLYGQSALDAELSQTIATGAIGYWLPLGLSHVDLAVTGGLRYVRVSSDVALTSERLPATLSGSQTEWWIDPTIGFAAQWKIDERWFVNATADIGGFGVGSKLSSTGYVGLGYVWTSSISSAVGYRYLYEDYESSNGDGGSFRYNTTMHGPTISLAWHF
ncbi:hypothetical protein [Ancylobacter oerskovii]|uniref:Outer membrane protein beta-barrel domain-containing protein n=1 Tax=Ancylobacter oerskovii TaxID=459519 RepID=A0ABW4YU29_9HYPH|nr:hypothetical protein [Ancylobacter oerskovii]MBS7543289.1 hypothetical protein [Ancylobacter oerskovii]